MPNVMSRVYKNPAVTKPSLWKDTSKEGVHKSDSKQWMFVILYIRKQTWKYIRQHRTNACNSHLSLMKIT